MSVQSIHAFAEKVALINDASSPVGRAIALQLALQGSYVIVGYSEPSLELERTMEELSSFGTLAAAVEMDPSSREGAAALVQHVDDRFGRLDLLVNCLKSESYSSFEATTNESFEAAVRADLGSVYFSIQSALRLMTARPKPRIVNVVSETSYECPLAASLREAIKELTRSLAKQLPRHYRLNGVEIGFETQPTDRGFDPELIREATGVSPDDAARAVLYLLSPEAKAVNGQIIKVN